MVCVLISFYEFFLSFSNGKRIFRGWGRVLIRFRVAASRVPRREDVLQWYYENSVSLLEKLSNLNIWTCLDMFYSNATCVRVCKLSIKNYRKTFQSKESHSLKISHIYIAFFVRAKNVYPWRKFKWWVGTPPRNKPISNFSPFAFKYSILKELNG